MDLMLRRTYRKQLTTLVSEAQILINNENANVNDILVIITRIKALQVNLNELNDKLAPTFQENQFERECEKIVEYNDKAVRTVAELEQRSKRENETRLQFQQPIVQNEDIQTARQAPIMVKLPKLNINKFDGDITKWPAFWEQYSTAIHNNHILDDAAKFAYLKSYLTDNAALTISNLTSSQFSYNDAIELLKSEYANVERIVDTYIQKLLTISHVKYDKDIQGLRKLYNMAASIVKSLRSLGISPDQYGFLVKSMIFKALPYNLRISFNKQKLHSTTTNDIASNLDGSTSIDRSVDYNKQITDLLLFIKVELDSMEQAQCSNGNNSRQNYFNRDHHNTDKPKHKQYTAAGLMIKVKDCCLFCKSKSHVVNECNSSLSIEEKKEILKQNCLCFRCGKPNHSSKFCRTKDVNCSKCKRKHMTSMCDPTYRERQNNIKTEVQNKKDNTNSTNLLANGSIGHVYLQTACVNVLTPQKRMTIRMIIDGGSQLTFVKENLSRLLRLPVIGTHKITIQAFGQKEGAPARLCNRVEVLLKSQHSDEQIIIEAIEVPEICFDSLEYPSLNDPVVREFAKNHKLADINLEQKTVNGISMLIGADNYWKIIKEETYKLTENLTAVNSKFGWTLLGNSNFDSIYEFNVNMVTVLNVQSNIEEINFRSFWDLESIGIDVNEEQKDVFTQDYTDKMIVFKNNRYEVALPWKTDQKLDSNYMGALMRVKNLTRKLLRDRKICEYDSAVRNYINNDCAELVSDNNLGNNKTYYMPHRPVYRDDKDTTKLRVVFDASAHSPFCESLNDQLHAGSNLLPDLIKVFLNLRIGKIGLIADIEKAFLQISLNGKDRDSHRFLWYEQPLSENTSSAELPNLATFRMKRVTFGVTISPFLLAVCLKKHFAIQPQQLRETANILDKSFYVDDLVIAVNTEEEAIKIYQQSKAILNSAKMNLRKWRSNNSEVSEHLRQHEDEEKRKELQKVLGLLWHTITDEISVDIGPILNEKENTYPSKRSVLQTIAKIFDPMGILVPFTVGAKILLQRIWKENLQWDEILPEKMEADWLKWYCQLPELFNFHLPRAVIDDRRDKIELHVFADASLQAYGVVAYLKCLRTKSCKFFIAKSRVAPIGNKGSRQLTLPKLELTAALCATRLQNYILKNVSLNIESIIMWSDSKITLYWIKGATNKKEVYIHNRATEIKNLNKGEWRYCPSRENPADMLTRGITARNLNESQMWKEGPLWLKDEPNNWPDNETVEKANVFINANPTEDKLKIINKPIFELERFDKLDKILRVTAYILRFVNNCRSEERKFGRLQIEEIREAEIYWIKFIQNEEFSSEIRTLKNRTEINRSSTIITLNPFLDKDGILRLGGRLQDAYLPFETKHPIILPAKSSFTKKVIVRCHENVMHSGVNATLNETRRKYWIIRGRQQIKSICGKCLKCIRFKGRPGNETIAPLPRERLTVANPFKITGVDFAGPLYVTENDSKKQNKVYIMLLTCAVVRAVHLELVPNLSAESCIRALRKFFARRGVPSIIYSDNAKTFKRASKEIQELSNILVSEKVQDLRSKYRIHC